MSLLARFRLENPQRSGDNPEGTVPTSTGDGDDLSSLGDPERLYFPPSSPEREPPTPGQRRRERSDSAEEVLRRESEQRGKRHCATQVCKDFELAEDALTAFAELNVPEMLITIFGKHLSLEQARIKDEVHSFIKSDGFKDVLQDRLRPALLSANISRYLNGINDRIWGFIKKNVSVFNISPVAMEDARMSMHIDTLMKDVLTKQRSQIKTKISVSISKKHHMSDLAKSLAGREFVNVTLAQWGRFAFLRQNYLLFCTIVGESLVKKVAVPPETQEDAANNNSAESASDETRSWSSNQFWEFIDQLLDEMREEVRKKPSADRKRAWEQYFTDTLQLDIEKFPPENRSASLHPSDGKSIPEWQKAIHQTLAWL